eukprot:10376788-Alexandrium_andersonii.AAC.1
MRGLIQAVWMRVDLALSSLEELDGWGAGGAEGGIRLGEPLRLVGKTLLAGPSLGSREGISGSLRRLLERGCLCLEQEVNLMPGCVGPAGPVDGDESGICIVAQSCVPSGLCSL